MATAARLDDADWMDHSDWTADATAAFLTDATVPSPVAAPDRSADIEADLEMGATLYDPADFWPISLEWREVMAPTTITARRLRVPRHLVALVFMSAFAIVSAMSAGVAILIA